jgi:hypothetical protein
MEFSQVLQSIKKSHRNNWQEIFADKAQLLKEFKKKDPSFSKTEKKRFRAFLEVDGNNRVLAALSESYTAQKKLCNEIAVDMIKQGENHSDKNGGMAEEFLRVCTDFYENQQLAKELEQISANIFNRKIPEQKRFALLSKSHNPKELFELGEISLKTEDYFNLDNAILYYEKAAEYGISEGLFPLGLYYQLDEKNFDKAKEYFEKLLSYNNPKGYTGLALLAKDPSENNTYYDLEKAKEYATQGYEKGCGTSMYILGGLDVEKDPAARSLLIESTRQDVNIHEQFQSAYTFINNLVTNVRKVYPDYAKKQLQAQQGNINDMLMYLFASKYNMVENYALFLEKLDAFVADIIVTQPEAKLSEEKVLNSIGMNKNLFELLASQYSYLDEKAAALNEKFQGCFQGN